MSLDFYDAGGRPYAYSDDGETIYTFGGKPIGYIDGESVYAFNGGHLGYFEDGAIRDKAGNTILFSGSASGGPVKPIKQIKPIKGIKQIKPIKGIKQVKPVKPIKGLNWSQLKPEQLFEA